eukprot:scaffold5962_cov103-Isochrysis_galbana.AAC.6
MAPTQAVHVRRLRSPSATGHVPDAGPLPAVALVADTGVGAVAVAAVAETSSGHLAAARRKQARTARRDDCSSALGVAACSSAGETSPRSGRRGRPDARGKQEEGAAAHAELAGQLGPLSRVYGPIHQIQPHAGGTAVAARPAARGAALGHCDMGWKGTALQTEQRKVWRQTSSIHAVLFANPAQLLAHAPQEATAS